jgi:hypothetical protein
MRCNVSFIAFVALGCGLGYESRNSIGRINGDWEALCTSFDAVEH